MKIVTPSSYHADMIQLRPRAGGGGTWVNDPPTCSECGQAAAALVELVTYDTHFGDTESFRLCATCLQKALDGVKAADVKMTATTERCSSCCHWKRAVYASSGAQLFGECDRVFDIYPDIARPTGAISVDGEGYTSSVCTGQDFGCIHWEGSHDTR